MDKEKITVLQALRKTKGVSMTSVANAIGLNSPTLAVIEFRKKILMPAEQRRLSKYYGVPVESFVDDKQLARLEE